MVRCKMNATALFRDAVYTVPQAVLYFKNVEEFHRTRVNVFTFTPIRKEWPSMRKFKKCTDPELYYVQLPQNAFLENWKYTTGI